MRMVVGSFLDTALQEEKLRVPSDHKNELAVVLLSGGLDSTTLLYYVLNMGYKVEAVSFNYGQRHHKELQCAMRTCMKLGIDYKILDLSVLNKVAPSCLTRKDQEVPEGNYADDNMKQTVVPKRNMVLLALATSYAIGLGAKYLYYGAHSGDHTIYPDCRPAFVDRLGAAIKVCDWNPPELKVPFLYWNKGDIVRTGQALGVDFSLTWTCYKGSDEPCQKCGSCTERSEAFQKAGIKDPLIKEE